ncbi:MAG: hypothetical protein QW196_05395 [Sulfolobales archaeon]
MYASYYYVAGASATDVLNDIVAILTGTTDVNALSQSCDKSLTQIRTTYSQAGWTLVASPTSTRRVLSAPISTIPTRNKFVRLDVDNTAYLRLSVMRNYTTTEVGLYTATDVFQQRLNLTAGGRMDIYADSKTLLLFSYQSGSFGNSSVNGITGVVEVEKDASKIGHVVDLSYPVVCINPFLQITEVYNTSGTLQTTSWQSVSLSTKLSPTTFTYNNNNYAQIVPMYFAASPYCLDCLSDVFFIPNNYGAIFDTLVWNNKTWVIWGGITNSGQRTIVPYG